MVAESSPLEILSLAVLMVGAWWFDRREESDDGRGDLEAAREAYSTGEITLEEFERRAELAVDGEAEKIRSAVEEVSGVGPETSAAVALSFDTFEQVRRADRDELESVHGVGPSTADALRERFG